MLECSAAETEKAEAVIAPHAGWFFSGALASRALAALKRDVDTVIVAGGHLPKQTRILCAEEDAIETPLGLLFFDHELRDALRQELTTAPDSSADNSVEVLLPAVRYFFPTARLVWLRLPPCASAKDAGAFIAEKAAALGRRTVFIASTDLTHYGPAYGWMPQGNGASALRWVRTVNDARFIEAVLAGDTAAVLLRAEAEHSACSAGAVLAALGFCRQLKPRVLAYTTSADVLLAAGEGETSSFVGYAAITLA
jgi:AmmeMemoRadiSam system protein B